jgi:thiamine-monophosphate kinase
MPLLKNMGEQKVIHLLQPFIDSSTLLGRNEDAYLYNNQPPYILVNVDTMSRDSDFLPKQSWKQIGAKLVTITYSDLCAKGAKPDLFLSSLVLEDTMEETDLQELVGAIQAMSHEYKTRYYGGDLGTSSESVLTGVGIGSISRGKVLARREAQENDLICVTGHFGLTSIGFDYLLSSKPLFAELPDNLISQALTQLYEPKLRLLEGTLLSESGIVTASIDSSDGLAISLHWLSMASKVGILIDTLPIHPDLELYLNSPEKLYNATFFGGEEYELIFTIPPHKLEELKHLFKKNNCNFFVIGKCVNSKGVFYSKNGHSTPIKMQGWDTFRREIF